MKKLLLFLLPVVIATGLFIAYITFIAKDNGKGALQVTSVPVSSVYLNGTFIGKTPLCKCDALSTIPVGDYALRVVPVDASFAQEAFAQHIVIAKGVLTVVDRTFGIGPTSQGSIITLFPITDSTVAQLALSSIPTGVAVSLDGNTVGNTPLTVSHVIESDHDVLFSKSGYKLKDIPVHTRNGYKLSVVAYLAIDPTAIASASAASSSASQSVQKIIILDTPTGFLRVRSEPSLGGTEVAQVKPGETYTLLNEQDGWYEIKLSDTQTGWVNSTYASKQ